MQSEWSPELGGDGACSPRSYARAVILSSLFGFVGAHLFYLGRVGEGLLDLGLSVGWIFALAIGEPGWAALLIVLDFGHAFVVTILLLTGSFRDGNGLRVCYPGQRTEGLRRIG